MQKIDINAALQAHPEYLNEQINDHDKAIYAKGWNDCNKEYYNAITELPVASIACTDLSMRLRRTFEADELVNQRILLEAADAIEELNKALDAVNDAHNEGYDVGYWAARRDFEPRWISVEERLPEIGRTVLTSDGVDVWTNWRLRVGNKGVVEIQWAYNVEEVTHWMPLPAPPKEVE